MFRLAAPLLAACALLLFPFSSSAAQGWMDPGTSATAEARQIALIYNGQKHRKWTSEDLLPYVAWMAPDGSPRSWLFDTFLILPLTAPSGNCFYPGHSPTPSDLADWNWYLNEKLFGGERHLAALNSAVADAATTLGSPAYRGKVILTIPFPDTRQTKFGDMDGDGRSEDLSRQEDRLAVVTSYVRQCRERWEQARLDHLELIGFYWLEEQILTADDRQLVPRVGELVRQGGQKFFWIPYFQNPSRLDWRSHGFDCALFQPNYFFRKMPPERVSKAAEIAAGLGMGMELECDESLLKGDPEIRDRYRNYLDSGARMGYMTSSVCAWYTGIGVLTPASRSSDPVIRALYDCTAHFVHGTYTPDMFPESRE